MADPTTGRELNRLYWDTDASVSEIADRLDISRRALYDGIEPRPAGRPCPECGAPLGFRNRTALERREAECPECGTTADVNGGAAGPDGSDAGRGASGRGDAAGGDADREGAGPGGPGGTGGPGGEPRRLPDAGAGPVLGGAFIAGVVLGALTTRLLQRR